jgi:hypothetical protein
MRRSFTAVISRNETFVSDFETEPYECGWASEARWFVRVLEMDGKEARLEVQTQISPDGLFWCDAESDSLHIDATGLHSTGIQNFGNWLRLRGTLLGDRARFKLLIYLVLKE